VVYAKTVWEDHVSQANAYSGSPANVAGNDTITFYVGTRKKNNIIDTKENQSTLPILLCNVQTKSTTYNKTRILIDSGAEISMIDRHYIEKQGMLKDVYETTGVHIKMIVSSIRYIKAIKKTIGSTNTNYKKICFKAFVLDYISDKMDMIKKQSWQLKSFETLTTKNLLITR
jgi:hypothetical protein